jgi:metal-responsive CopG/Arc/MetJ family transcriptional regulator
MGSGRPMKGGKIEFSIRLDAGMLKQIDALAEKEVRNRNNMIEFLLIKTLQRERPVKTAEEGLRLCDFKEAGQ